MVVSAGLYGCEMWVMTESDGKTNQVIVMRFMKYVDEVVLLNIQLNESIRKLILILSIPMMIQAVNASETSVYFLETARSYIAKSCHLILAAVRT
jgi:hypothetical protein